MKRILFLTFIIAFFSASSGAQDKNKKDDKPPKNWGFELPKKTKITLKLPIEYLSQRAISVGPESGGVSINGRQDWKELGFPSLADCEIGDISIRRAGNSKDEKALFIYVFCKEAVLGLYLGFRQGFTDVNSAFKEIAIIGNPNDTEAKTYLENYKNWYIQKYFTGELASLQPSKKMSLVDLAKKLSVESKVKSEIYKDQQYFVLDMGKFGSTFNTLRMPQSARLARVINDQMLDALRVLEKELEGVTDFSGIKLQTQIDSKDFSNDFALPGYENLQIYVPRMLIRKFAEAEITSQQLIDGSIVLVEGNRVQVPLAEAK